AQLEPLQPDDPGDHPAPPGGGQGEVRRGGAVRVPTDPRPPGAVPPAVEGQRPSPGGVAAAGGGLRAEDQPAQPQRPAGEGAGQVQGAEPGGAADPPPERAAGGGAGVPEEPGADRRPAVHPGVGADAAGPDGAASAAGTEG